MMFSAKFCVGDWVDVVPYDAVADNWGIGKIQWDDAVQNNPHLITNIVTYETNATYNISGPQGDFYWPQHALVPAVLSHFADVDDLL